MGTVVGGMRGEKKQEINRTVVELQRGQGCNQKLRERCETTWLERAFRSRLFTVDGTVSCTIG